MSERPHWECESPKESASGDEERATERAGDERGEFVIRRGRRHHHEEDEELVVEEGAALVDSEDDVPHDHSHHEAEERSRRDPDPAPEGVLSCGCRGRCTCGTDDGSAFRDLVAGLVGETVSIVVSETTFSGRLACAGSSYLTVVRNSGGGSSLDIAYVPIRQILGVRV